MAGACKFTFSPATRIGLDIFVYLVFLTLHLFGVYAITERSRATGFRFPKTSIPLAFEGLIVALLIGLPYVVYKRGIVKWLRNVTLRKKVSVSSPKTRKQKKQKHPEDPLSLFERAFLHVELFVLLLFGQLREFLRYLGIEKRGLFEKGHEGYVSLYDDYVRFYANNILKRAQIIINHTICGVPGAEVDVLERETIDHGWTLRFTGKVRRQVNLASYNYLGFAQNEGPCATEAFKAVHNSGLGSCSSRRELGTHKIITELEALTARFLGVEDAMVFAMGFATNSMNIPALVGKGCLVLSDELNHASIVLGCRLTGATCRTFKHADMKDLEIKLINNIVVGPSSDSNWRKILIVVEGIYSMEGTIIDLPRLIELKKKYKCYLYLDEAHSIGALGSHGRGVVDYFNCDPNDIDILMGTFTKSFGAAGGYIAGSKRLIKYLKTTSHNYSYGVSMSPPVSAQVISSMKIIMGEDGTNDGQLRLAQLATNTAYFRKKLRDLGFTVIGSDDSPVVAVMIYSSTKTLIQKEFQKLDIALVAVGFPAVPMGKARLRLCISAGHTKEMLDKGIKAISDIGDKINAKHSKKFLRKNANLN